MNPSKLLMFPGIVFMLSGVFSLVTGSQGTVGIAIGAAFFALSWHLKKPSNGADDAR